MSKLLEILKLLRQGVETAVGAETPPKADKQERVQPVAEEPGEDLLDIAPDSRVPESPLPADSLEDVGEELVEDDEPVEEEEIITPKKKKNTSLRTGDDDEILEEGEVNGRGNKACVRVALSRAPRKNRFRDNTAFAQQDTLDFDKKVRTKASIAAHNSIPKREAIKKIVVMCRECKRKFKIDPRLAPQRLDVGDKSSYHCDGCVLSKKG